MIIKGKSRARADQLASHLLRRDHNERVEVRDSRGTVATDVRGALREMEAMAAGSRSTKPFYHGVINPAEDRQLTPAQLLQAVDALEEKLGLAGQPRIVVVHEKLGREHAHVAWSRINLERGTAVPDSWNYVRHEEVARELERLFGHERVQGAFVERDGKPRPERTATLGEMTQANRAGISRDEVKAELTEIWRESESGREFRLHAEYAGYVLARGDQRTFVVMDPAGQVHALARRIEGAKTKDIREKLQDVDLDRLPSVAGARETVRDRLAELRDDLEREQKFEAAALKAVHAKEASEEQQRRAKAEAQDILMRRARNRMENRLTATLYSSADYVSMTRSAQRHLADKVRQRESYRKGVAAKYWAVVVPEYKARARKREDSKLKKAQEVENQPLDRALKRIDELRGVEGPRSGPGHGGRSRDR